ncbi:hypothetical protein HYT92_00305 [Candidatus Pacearchaeota archaeon]|nr:hypothetical protein [Candidatus Pacearchaeota archaeon]
MKRYLVFETKISGIEKELSRIFDELCDFEGKADIGKIEGRLFKRFKCSHMAEIVYDDYVQKLKTLPKSGRRIYPIWNDNTISRMNYTEF